YHSRAKKSPVPPGKDAMPYAQLSLARMMARLSLLAANLAAARMLFAYNVVLLIGVIVGMIAFQVAAYRLFRSRGRTRAFWAGFLVAGLMVMGSFVWATIFPEVLGLTVGGTLVRTPGSSLHVVWYQYTSLVFDHMIQPLMAALRINPQLVGDS